MVGCSILGCKSRSEQQIPGLTFYSFPSDSKIRKLWIKQTGRMGWEPNKHSRVCCIHFDVNEIEIKKTRGYLKPHVVPTKHIHHTARKTSFLTLGRSNRRIKKDGKSWKQNKHTEGELVKKRAKDQRGKKTANSPEALVRKRRSPRNVTTAEKPPTSGATADHIQIGHVFTKHIAVFDPEELSNHEPNTVDENQHVTVGTNNVEASESVFSDSDSERTRSNIESVGKGSDIDSDVETEITAEAISDEAARYKMSLSKAVQQPMLYMGIPRSANFILNKLATSTYKPLYHICLTLRKLRLNESFEILANEFGLKKSTASKIFEQTCPSLAVVLEELIIQPTSLSVQRNLPIVFRRLYPKMYCIIHCLEIGIDVPCYDLNRLSTCSANKKFSTIKYLISCTPDGVINFVSKGFGGCTTDSTICRKSNFFALLPDGAGVMPVGAFKQIDSELLTRNIFLIRPTPSSTNGDDEKDQNAARLAAHINRVFGRLQEFSFLKSRACIDHDLVPYLDHAVIICCALNNLQPTSR